MIGPVQSPTWRVAHPCAWAVWLGLVVGATVVWAPLALTVLGWLLAQLLAEAVWRVHAARRGFRAQWVIPGPARWWRPRLRALGIPLPPGPVWEMHAVDTHRWPGSPQEGAGVFRRAYTTEMYRWTSARPPTVSLVCSTFNRLRAEEVDWIRDHDGWIAARAIHPTLPRAIGPSAYARLQRRLFGGVASIARVDDPGRWTTWVLPARP